MALHAKFISEEVDLCRVEDQSVLDFRELQANSPAAGGNVSGPGAIAHAEQNWPSRSDVSGFTFVANNGSVAASTTIQN